MKELWEQWGLRGAVFWAMVLVALIVAACGSSAPQSAAPTTAPADVVAGGEDVAGGEEVAVAGESGRCGDPSRLAESLNFYNWTNYIDDEILRMFEAECGVRIVYDTYSSNEDLLAKLQAGATGYDLIVPSDYMVSIMIQLDMLQELDHANIPNLSNISPRFFDAPYDPGFVHSVPYQWGTTGIAVDLDAVNDEPDGWASLFDPEIVAQFGGRVSLLNDGRETLGAALKYLGYSLNTTDPAELEEAKQVLLAVKPYIATFDSDGFEELLLSGETVIAHSWSGNAFQAIFSNPDRNLEYVIPAEGSVIWVDNMAIPRTASSPYTAEVFINYILEPEIGAMLTNFNYYTSPNDASFEFLDEDVRTDPGIYPPDDVLERLEFISDVGEATLLYERIWTEVRAGQ